MAFVYRQQKYHSYIQKQPYNIGPGDYKIEDQQIEQKIYTKNIPFKSSSYRYNPVKENNQGPGPGQYNINFQQRGISEKDFTIESAVFKSKDTRISFEQNDNPGPGDYDQGVQSNKKGNEKCKNNKALEEILQLHRAKVVNSQEQRQLIINCDIPNSMSQEQYLNEEQEITSDIKANHALNWSTKQSSTTINHQIQKLLLNNIGPGYYGRNIQENEGLRKHSQSVHIGSQSRIEKQKMENNKIKEESQEDEYVENAVPGPGYYSNKSVFGNIKHNQCFLSYIPRFPKEKSFDVGPGEYSVDAPQYQIKTKKQPAFLSSEFRFAIKKKSKSPGPASYDQKISLENELISSLKRAPLGNFGVYQPRFEMQEIKQTGPGYYTIEEKQNIKGGNLKSNVKRKLFEDKFKSLIPGPNAYDQSYHQISSKKDEDLYKQNKVPFDIGEIRFKPQFKQKQNDDASFNERDIKDLFGNEHNKLNIGFNSNSPRFRREVEQQIKNTDKPNEIERKSDKWIKKSFNILFAQM